MSSGNGQKETQPNLKKMTSPQWSGKNCQVQQQEDGRNQECIYCGKQDQKSDDCKTVATVDDCEKVLSNKPLCFNYTGNKHRSS